MRGIAQLLALELCDAFLEVPPAAAAAGGTSRKASQSSSARSCAMPRTRPRVDVASPTAARRTWVGTGGFHCHLPTLECLNDHIAVKKKAFTVRGLEER